MRVRFRSDADPQEAGLVLVSHPSEADKILFVAQPPHGLHKALSTANHRLEGRQPEKIHVPWRHCSEPFVLWVAAEVALRRATGSVRAQSLGFEDVERVAREVPEPTHFILHKLLHREPAQRYPTAAELERALRERLRVLGHRGAPEVAEEAFQLKAEASGFMPERLGAASLQAVPTADALLDPDQLSTQ